MVFLIPFGFLHLISRALLPRSGREKAPLNY